jgi:hypothetical protein
MKELYLAVSNKLAGLEIFRSVDLDKGQLENGGLRPSVAFPCALIKIGLSFDEYGGGIKNRNASVRVRLAFDQPTSRTAVGVGEEARAASLEYIEKAEEVFEALRAFEPDDYTGFEISEFIQEDRSDGLVVMRLTFRTNRLDA